MRTLIGLVMGIAIAVAVGTVVFAAIPWWVTLLVGAGALLLVPVACLACLAWMAKGDPGLNGDPERDGGWTEEEIRRADRGAATRSATRRREP